MLEQPLLHLLQVDFGLLLQLVHIELAQRVELLEHFLQVLDHQRRLFFAHFRDSAQSVDFGVDSVVLVAHVVVVDALGAKGRLAVHQAAVVRDRVVGVDRAVENLVVLHYRII